MPRKGKISFHFHLQARLANFLRDIQPNFHNICNRCEIVCASSLLPKAEPDWTTKLKVVFKIGKLFREGQSYEAFPLWETPRQLHNSAAHGCHLCKIFWSQLNAEQQAELLAGDARIEEEMSNSVDQAGSDEQRISDLICEFRQRRLIWIGIQLTAQPNAFAFQASIVVHFGALRSLGCGGALCPDTNWTIFAQDAKPFGQFLSTL